jgi:hypothetical protein
MADIPPIPSLQPLQDVISAIPNKNFGGLLSNVPHAISRLSHESVLEGIVGGRDRLGNILVNTANGSFFLTPNKAINLNDVLSFRVIRSNENFQLQLYSINHNPIEGLLFKINNFFRDNTAEPLNLPASATYDVVNNSEVIASGTAVKGLLLSTNPVYINFIISKLINSGAIKDSAEIILPVSLTNVSEQNKLGLEQLKLTAEQLPIGSIAEFTIAKLDITGATDNTSLMPNPILTMEAEIISSDNIKGTILKTPIGIVQLADKIIPLNAHLTLNLTSITPNLQASIYAPPISKYESLLQIIKGWSSLNNIIDTARIHSTAAAEQFVRTQLPQADHNLAAAILSFIEIIRSKGAAEWLGNNITNLLKEPSSKHLIDNLDHDFSSLRDITAPASSQRSSNPWQAFFFPVYDGQTINLARLFVRYYKPEVPTSNEEKYTRFIIELDTEMLDKIQFDGLVKMYHDAGHLATRLNLMLRSLHELPNELKLQIQDIFNSASELTGMKGTLEFSLVKQFSNHPLEDVLDDYKESNLWVG